MNANVIEVKPFNITKIELVALRGPKGETGYPTPEQVQTAVDAWLEDHPEATTTVQDGAITTVKLHDNAVTEDKLSESLQSLLITDTASGSIASFSDGSDGINVRDLIVNVEPSQDLHGYSNPWPAGGGKNKLPYNLANMKTNNTAGTWSGSVYTHNGITFTVNDDGTVKANGTASSTAQLVVYKEYTNCPFNGYILNGCPSGGSNTKYDLRASDVDTSSNADIGSGTTINLTSTGKWQCVILIRSGVTVSNLMFSPMIRLAAESDATYAPYSNICPITGWENVKVKRIWNQANLLKFSDATITANGITAVAKNGMISLSGTLTGQYTFEFPLSNSVNLGPGQNYIYFNNKVASNNINVYFFRDTTTVHYWSLYEKDRVITSWTDSGNEVVNKIGIRLATVGTNFDGVIISPVLIPKDDTTTIAEVTIPLGSTVYGGTLDVTTGVLTVDRAMVDLGTLTWNYDSPNSRFKSTAVTGIKPPASAEVVANALCSQYPVVAYNSMVSNDKSLTVIWASSGSAGQIWIHETGYSSAASFKTAMSGVKFVYELATPTTVQLTPQQMTTLLGQNNIFADAGDVDVTYVADTKKYIAKMIANALNA